MTLETKTASSKNWICMVLLVADDREDSIASFEEKNISDYSGEDNPESSGVHIYFKVTL